VTAAIDPGCRAKRALLARLLESRRPIKVSQQLPLWPSTALKKNSPHQINSRPSTISAFMDPAHLLRPLVVA